MSATRSRPADLTDVIDRLERLVAPHTDVLGVAFDAATFTISTDGQHLLCPDCVDNSIPNVAVSFDELRQLRWAALCSHALSLHTILALMDDTELASTLTDVDAIRRPRQFGFQDVDQSAVTAASALTLGLAYSAFQMFVDGRYWLLEKSIRPAATIVLQRELDQTRARLEHVHDTTIGSAAVRNALRDEARKMATFSDDDTLGWIVFGHTRVSVGDSDLLRPQTLARALQASYAPQSLQEDRVVAVPRWVAEAITQLSATVTRSSFHTGLSRQELDTAETLWKEANGGLYADFDMSVDAARHLR